MRYWLFPPFIFVFNWAKKKKPTPPPKGGGKQNPFKYFEQNLLDSHCWQVINALPLRKCLSKILSRERESIFKIFSYVLSTYFLWIFRIKNISSIPCRHGSTAVFYEVPPPSPFFACLVSPHPWETTVGEGDSFWFLFGVERGKRKRSPLSSKGGGLSSSSSSSSPSVGLVFLFFFWETSSSSSSFSP